MGAQVVGSSFIFIGILAVTVALIVIKFKVPWFIPTQGSSRGDYGTRLKTAIPLALGSGALLAKSIGLGLNSWDRNEFYFVGVSSNTFVGTFGLFSVKVAQFGSHSYSSMCSTNSAIYFENQDSSACNMVIFGAFVTLIGACISLLLSLLVVGHGVLFFLRPEHLPQYVFRTWRMAGCCWPITLLVSNTWGGVSHLCLQALTSSGVSWSYQAFLAAFFIEWFIALFYFFAVKNTGEFGSESGERRQQNDALTNAPLSDSDAQSLAQSQARIRELEDQLAREKAASSGPRDPNSVMRHPSIPTPAAARQSWPMAPAQPPAQQRDHEASSQEEFYSSYQPPRAYV